MPMTRNPDILDDLHYCIKCQNTLLGIDKYILHCKCECPMRSATTKPFEHSVSTESEINSFTQDGDLLSLDVIMNGQTFKDGAADINKSKNDFFKSLPKAEPNTPNDSCCDTSVTHRHVVSTASTNVDDSSKADTEKDSVNVGANAGQIENAQRQVGSNLDDVKETNMKIFLTSLDLCSKSKLDGSRLGFCKNMPSPDYVGKVCEVRLTDCVKTIDSNCSFPDNEYGTNRRPQRKKSLPKKLECSVLTDMNRSRMKRTIKENKITINDCHEIEVKEEHDRSEHLEKPSSTENETILAVLAEAQDTFCETADESVVLAGMSNEYDEGPILSDLVESEMNQLNSSCVTKPKCRSGRPAKYEGIVIEPREGEDVNDTIARLSKNENKLENKNVVTERTERLVKKRSVGRPITVDRTPFFRRVGKSKFQCLVVGCGKLLKHGSLEQHRRVHTGEKPFHCHLCAKAFSQKGSLHSHVRRHLGERNFFCSICKASFLKKNSLNRHLMTHKTDRPRPFVCDQCGSSFMEKSQLHYHYKLHTGKLVKCQFDGCKLTFRSQSELAIHSRVHTNERPYLCVTCGYTGKTRHALTKHERTHTTIRPYQCKYCEYAGRTKLHLQRHLRLHTGVKPYKCPYCDYSCNVHENVRKHIMKTKKHHGQAVYPCKFCPFGSNNATKFRDHLLDDHIEEVKKTNFDMNTKDQVALFTGLYDKESDINAMNNEPIVLQPVRSRAEKKNRLRTERASLKRKDSRRDLSNGQQTVAHTLELCVPIVDNNVVANTTVSDPAIILQKAAESITAQDFAEEMIYYITNEAADENNQIIKLESVPADLEQLAIVSSGDINEELTWSPSKFVTPPCSEPTIDTQLSVTNSEIDIADLTDESGIAPVMYLVYQ